MQLRRRRQPGQSIVLLALVMVVLVGMTGLSVDVGNAYAQQRRVQNAANAGALAGMNAVLDKQTNMEVWNSVQESLAGNRVDTDSADYTYQADYLLKNGTVQSLGKWNGTTNTFTVGTPPATNTLARVQVTVTERVPTYFARVVGRTNFTVNENGEACLGSYGLGVYPIGVPFDLQYRVNRSGGGGPERYHRIFKRNPNPLVAPSSNNALVEITQTSDPAWSAWVYRQELYIYLPIENWGTDLAGTHIAWLDWNGGSSDADELRDALTSPGTLPRNFTEFADKTNTGTKPGELEQGDWIEGGTGVKATADDPLRILMDTNTPLLLPMYNDQDKVNGKSAFQYGPEMGRFLVAGFDLNSQQGIRVPSSVSSSNQKYILLQYIKDATGGNANACS